jgi:hypothetical protein
VWGKVLPLESDAVKDYASVEVCLNERGEAFATFGGTGYGAWARWTGGAWTPASTIGVAQRRGCAMAADGTVMTLWSDTVGNVSTALLATLSPTNQWSTTKTVQTKATAIGIVAYGDRFLRLHRREPNGDVFSQSFDTNLAGSNAMPVLTGAAGESSLASAGTLALFAAYSAGKLQESLFEGAAWTPSELGPVSTGIGTCGAASGFLVTWLYAKNAYAARYDAVEGWRDPVKLGATTAEDWSPGAALDDAGNALSIFPSGSDVAWVRSPHAALEWHDGALIKNQDPKSLFATSATSGEVIAVWQNQLGVWATRFE